jgi:LPXTG-motif cell wall-anchored protein
MGGTARRILATLGAAVVVSAGLLGVTTQSAAADSSTSSPVVLVSTDGVNYTPTLTVGLFDDAGLLVPGDTATAELWIKNPTSDPATVRVSVGQVTTSSPQLGQNMTLTTVDTLMSATVTRTWDDLAQCDVVVEPVTVAGNSVLRVDLTLTMLNATGLQAQNSNASLNAVVAMRDDAAGSFPVSVCDPATTAPGIITPAGTTPAAGTSSQAGARVHAKVLGFTGDTFPSQLAILAGVLLGVGWFLLALRRRRKEPEGKS